MEWIAKSQDLFCTWLVYSAAVFQTKIKNLQNCIKHDSCDCKNLLLSEGIPWPTGYSCAYKQLSIGRCPKVRLLFSISLLVSLTWKCFSFVLALHKILYFKLNSYPPVWQSSYRFFAFIYNALQWVTLEKWSNFRYVNYGSVCTALILISQSAQCIHICKHHYWL